jgi:hypothetical protein
MADTRRQKEVTSPAKSMCTAGNRQSGIVGHFSAPDFSVFFFVRPFACGSGSTNEEGRKAGRREEKKARRHFVAFPGFLPSRGFYFVAFLLITGRVFRCSPDLVAATGRAGFVRGSSRPYFKSQFAILTCARQQLPTDD